MALAKQQAQVNDLLVLFPQFDRTILESVLFQKYSVQAAVEALLAMTLEEPDEELDTFVSEEKVAARDLSMPLAMFPLKQKQPRRRSRSAAKRIRKRERRTQRGKKWVRFSDVTTVWRPQENWDDESTEQQRLESWLSEPEKKEQEQLIEEPEAVVDFYPLNLDLNVSMQSEESKQEKWPVKIYFEADNDIRRIGVDASVPDNAFAKISASIKAKLDCELPPKYVDDEGDLVTIRTGEELAECFRICKMGGEQMLKLYVQ